MSLTTIIKQLYFQPRLRQLALYQQQGEALQRQVLQQLLQKAEHTEYGRKHNFSDIHTYDYFVKQIPVNTYEELKGDIDRMRHGEKDILWPDR